MWDLLKASMSDCWLVVVSLGLVGAFVGKTGGTTCYCCDVLRLCSSRNRNKNVRCQKSQAEADNDSLARIAIN